MKSLLDGTRRALTLAIAIASLALLALAVTGCGDDKPAAADAPGGATAAGGSDQGANGEGANGQGENGPESGGSGAGSKSGGDSGEGGSGSGGSGSGESGSGKSGGGDGGAGTKPGSTQNPGSGGAIVDNDSVDDPAASDPPKKLSAKERAGLSIVLGQAEGAAREYLRGPLSKGWFRADSNKVDDAIDDAQFVAPYMKRKLMLAAGSMQVGQSETLRRDLTAAYAMLATFEDMRKATAVRRVLAVLGALNAALRSARKAGVKIDVETPTRSEIKRES